MRLLRSDARAAEAAAVKEEQENISCSHRQHGDNMLRQQLRHELRGGPGTGTGSGIGTNSGLSEAEVQCLTRLAQEKRAKRNDRLCKWRAANREKANAYYRKWYAANREKKLAYCRKNLE